MISKVANRKFKKLIRFQEKPLGFLSSHLVMKGEFNAIFVSINAS